MRAPDYPGALTGWRVWRVVAAHDALRLASVLHDDVWPVGREAVARCRRSDDFFADAPELASHGAPRLRCTCGIYAARSREAVLPYLRGRDDNGTVCRVLGTVALWGRVVELEGGWRASHAYPLLLVVEDPDVRQALAPYQASFAERAASS